LQKPVVAPSSSKRGRKRKEVVRCQFCQTQESHQWRKDFQGNWVCETCLGRADSLGDAISQSDYPTTAVGDYVHQPYLTRTSWLVFFIIIIFFFLI